MSRSAADLKAALVDVRAVVMALQLADGMRPQPNGVMIKCPAHPDRKPSCSVQLVRSCLLWNCHACRAGGDVFDLIAAADELDQKLKFHEIIEMASKIADDIAWTSASAAPAPKRVTPTYPAPDEVMEIWRGAGDVESDPIASAWCGTRRLDPRMLDGLGLASVLERSGSHPSWAACGRPWSETGHRLIVQTWDACGVLRSVRARAVGRATDPKELSPRGHSTKGLVLANADALRMLRGSKVPAELVITEGTPDFLTWATHNRFKGAVLGIIGGVGLAPDVAAKIPNGARVAVRVDQDDAGRRYQARIIELLASRCNVCVMDEGT